MAPGLHLRPSRKSKAQHVCLPLGRVEGAEHFVNEIAVGLASAQSCCNRRHALVKAIMLHMESSSLASLN